MSLNPHAKHVALRGRSKAEQPKSRASDYDAELHPNCGGPNVEMAGIYVMSLPCAIGPG